MNAEEARREAAARIQATHRRQHDHATPTRVTISPHTPEYDLVRVEYADGEVREFERLAPDAQ